MVRDQKFRDDLWYRLNAFPILIPPLKKRKSAIPTLVNHFISVKSRKLTYDQANGEEKDDVDKLDVVIARHIKNVLSRTQGKVHGKRGAAEVLGVNASTLRHRMQKLGIDYKKEFSEIVFCILVIVQT